MNGIIATEFANGLTISELRNLIESWPDVDENGEPFTVWIQTGAGLSSPVTAVWPLNKKNEDSGADLLLEYS